MTLRCADTGAVLTKLVVNPLHTGVLEMYMLASSSQTRVFTVSAYSLGGPATPTNTMAGQSLQGC